MPPKRADRRREVERRTFTGTIKSYDAQKGYGFIQSDEALEQFNCDVFVHHKHLGDLCVRDVVEFRIKVNAEGRPQAVELTLLSAADQGDTSGGGRAGEEMLPGTIKLIDSARGFGFIQNDDVSEWCSRDTFVPQNLLEGFHVGEEVFFHLRLHNGCPQATQLFHQAQLEDFSSGTTVTGSLHAHAAPCTQLYHGVVKKIDLDRGFGFITCQAVFEQYNSDVFATSRQMEGYALGDPVSFFVRLNKKGQPQAVDLTQGGQQLQLCNGSANGSVRNGCANGYDLAPDDERQRSSYYAASMQELSVTSALSASSAVGTTMSGTIKSFDATNGYGFIACPEARERFGRDVFLHSKQIKHFQVKDFVTFTVRASKNGDPQAWDLREGPESLAWLTSPAEVGEEDEAPAEDGANSSEEKDVSDKFHTGEIKSFNSLQGYGFINCPSLRDHYGRDVFIHQSQMEGCTVGDRVTFRVRVKGGQPQAFKVAQAPAELPVLSEKEVAQWRRQFLRACSSTTLESLEVMRKHLTSGVDPDARDATGHLALQLAALNVCHGEKKCRLLIEWRANLQAECTQGGDVVKWARERVSPRFAEFLRALGEGESVDCELCVDVPRDND